ncbi:hypothetical protein VNO77_03060 [Canavalia gladiata]|uniref:Uncharacterized protein n=1 Tax=Canavalia gladiata TaxID=3824 RepID=A0AAN9MU36_CANGL
MVQPFWHSSSLQKMASTLQISNLRLASRAFVLFKLKSVCCTARWSMKSSALGSVCNNRPDKNGYKTQTRPQK